MAAPDLESFRRSSMFDGSFRQSLRDGLLPQQTSDYSYMFEDRTHARCCSYRYFSDKITGFVKKSKDFLVTAWEMGTTDPRKIIFSAKMGLALTLVNLLIFFKLPGSELSNHYLWAILTIVVIFEFSIGGTFRKGCNTGLGTLSAGALALGMAEISDMTGNWAEVFNTASIVVVAFLGTYAKLYPTMKPYEYGFRAFLLTYCYVIVSGYRTGEFVETAVSRILMIALGAEELQSKIDDKWYLLVNDDNWEIGNPFRDATDELEKSDLYEEDLRQISIEDMWLAPEGEEESRMYKSASDLSLATYDELCVVAHFEEAIG
uniref:Aluminum-activated malate transporter n=1 Tax=Brassica oleracea var. oleracea TaxID=109376 RepID=A0A0D3DWP1_BRAOL